MIRADHTGRRIEWTEYQRAVDSLVTQIRGSNLHTWPLVAIARGGLIPATMISHRLVGQRVYTIDIQAYTQPGLPNEQGAALHTPLETLAYLPSTFLLVDDLLDSGTTFRALSRMIQEHTSSEFAYAVVYDKGQAEITPDFVGKYLHTQEWLIFPYETQAEEPNQPLKRSQTSHPDTGSGLSG